MKKNPGGRPRKNAVSGGKAQPVGWKQVTKPVSRHHYEVSSQGEVRRKKKDGSYYMLKPWVTGGPYAAVYLTGVAGATRNRKKVYVHRLVADHFVQGKTSGKVVHHKVGPGSNTAQNLQWVTPSENLKARKFFNDDGSRKKKSKKTPKIIPAKKPVQKTAPIPKEKKIEPKQSAPPPKPQNKLPDDPEEYYNAPTFLSKLTYLVKKWKPFRKEWLKFRKRVPEVNQKNFPEKFKQATGKKLKLGESPAAWDTRMRSAMFEIERRLERSEE